MEVMLNYIDTEKMANIFLPKVLDWDIKNTG